MIESIIRFSIYNKLIIGLLVGLLAAWGIYSASHLPIDAVPDITDNQVQVITSSPTLAAQEVEQFITFPLELKLGNIPGVVNIRSVSRFGLSVITVVFEEEMDIYLARQLIGERILAAQAEIPEGMGQPEMGPITTGLGEIYQYVLYPAEGYEDKYTSTDLRTLQDWVVKRQLIGVPGVIEVNSSGGYLKQYEVAVNPDKLKSMGVTLPELFEAITRNNANAGGSYIEKKHYTYFIRGEGLLENKAEIEQVVVKNVNGIPILVKDVAKVQDGHAPRFGAVTMNGIGEVVAGQVMMLKGENSAEVTKRVKERMNQIQASLPEGVKIEPYLDRTKLVDRTTRTVITNLVEGGLIVVFVLVLLLGNFRAGLVVASVIPLSMLFALGMMRTFGVSANLMSLGAIDFGLIVDGAVIIVESIFHRLGARFSGQRLTQEQMNESVFTSSSHIRKSAAFGEIIILIVYLPILILTGVEGKMFKPMALTVSFAILGALILSLTYVPMMSSLILSKKISMRQNLSDRIMGVFHQLYRPALNVALRAKVPVLAVAFGLFALSLWQFNRMGGEFIPTLEEGDFALHQILPPGSSIAQGVEVSAELQKILLDNFPEVEKVVTKIGTAEIPTDIMPLEAGDIYVILKPKKEWTSASTREELFEKMEVEMNKFPGVMYEFTQPIQMRFNELMTGVRQDIAIKIYGEDLGLLLQHAREAEGIIQGIQGVGDIQVEPVAGLQQMVIDFDRSKMAKYGLDVQTLNQMIRGSFAGEHAGYIFEGEKRFDLVVRLQEDQRGSIEDIRNLYIPLPGGSQIPLYEVARIDFQEGPTQISRDNTQRRIVIGVNARNRDVESLVSEIEQQLDARLNLPTGYYLTFGGQFENLQRAKARLSLAVPAALGLIFVLLYLTFHSIKQTLLIFTAIPLSAIGGIWALVWRGMPFSISAGVGFIALFGVAVLNGIVLIAYLNQLKKEGMTDVVKRIRSGTTVRLRPVIMTAAVASLGFLPMAISTTAGAEVQQPLATVVIGGLVTATLLTMIILPVLYYYSETGFRWFRRNTTMTGIFILLGTGSALSQSSPVSLDEAIQLALTHHPAIQRDQLTLQQQQALTGSAAIQPFTNVQVTGEEWDFSRDQGIQSLGIFQNFYLPGVTRSRRSLLEAEAGVAQKQLRLTEWELRKQVERAWYEWLYAKESLALSQEQLEIYLDFVQIARIRFDAGETGKLPVLSAEVRLREASLQQQQAEQQVQLANRLFNNWLGGESEYEIDADTLPAPFPPDVIDIERHPFLLVAQQKEGTAKAEIAVAESQLLPQLNTGLQLQSVNGQTLFYGYQLGVNVPLFRKGYKARVEAAQMGLEAARAGVETQRLELQRQRTALQVAQQQQLQVLENLKNELVPVANEQLVLGREAYRQGEIRYLDYLESMRYSIDLQRQYLEALLKYHLISVELTDVTND